MTPTAPPSPAAPARRPVVPWRGRVLGVVMVGLATLALAELGLRVADRPPPRPLAPHYVPVQPRVRWIDVPRGGRTFVYEPDQDCLHCYDLEVLARAGGPWAGAERAWDETTRAPDGTAVGCVRYRISARGYRDRAPPTDGRDRPVVLVVGDSFTFGEGTSVAGGGRFSERLSAVARERGVELDVRNRGLQGLNLAGALGLYRARLRAERPDVVILALLPNDAQPFRQTLDDAAFLGAMPWRLPGEPARGPLRSLDLLARRLRARRMGGATVAHVLESFEGDSGRRFDRTLEAFAADVEASGARPVLLLFPMTTALGSEDGGYPFEEVHRHVAGVAGRLDLPLVDLLPDVRAWSRPRLWAHPTDPHPSAELHALAASRLAEVLVDVPVEARLEPGVARARDGVAAGRRENGPGGEPTRPAPGPDAPP